MLAANQGHDVSGKFVCVCMCVCVHACVCACVCVCVAEHDKHTALMLAANQGHDVSGKLVCLCVGVGVCGCGKELESLVMCGFRGCGWLVRVCRWLAVPCLMSCCLVCCLAV